MKKYLLLAFSLLCSSTAHAESDTNDAIYVWVNGSSTCYRLEGMPQVTYSNGSAVLTLFGKNVPELTIPLTDQQQLEVTFGIYKNEATEIIDDCLIESKVVKKGKYISGGKLIIIKNGKKYNSQGVEIK